MWSNFSTLPTLLGEKLANRVPQYYVRFPLRFTGTIYWPGYREAIWSKVSSCSCLRKHAALGRDKPRTIGHPIFLWKARWDVRTLTVLPIHTIYFIMCNNVIVPFQELISLVSLEYARHPKRKSLPFSVLSYR